MANFEITITFDGTQFFYKDEHNKPAKYKRHLNANDTIKWKLEDYGSSFEIDFNKNGNPFDPSTSAFKAKTNKWTQPGTCSQSHNTFYDYSVTAFDAQGNVLHTEDPQIMFDDGSFPIFDSGKLGFPDPAVIAQSAEQAWEKIFDKLNSAKQGERGSAIQFYPHGITDIELSVGFSGVTVTVKVSGPDS
jgi:hypothetical protein